MKFVVRTILAVFLIQLFLIPFLNDGARAMYSNRSERLFREAAKQYWEAHDWDSSAYCSPYETQIVYTPFADINNNYLARVAQIGDGNRAYKESPYYCKTWFNTRHKQSRRQACVTFIHEFGHLMGRVHNTNMDSPMYNGFEEFEQPKKWRLYVRWRQNILGKSLCNAGEIHG